MPLQEYQEKRDFSRTPEPQGSQEQPGKGPLRFVVQKHRASHLHYDFRLELDGVLKSWAIPKGPSLDPGQRKLAIQVEDHPLEYRDFEGVIPEGEYGAGTVMLWDEGTYYVPGVEGRQDNEAVLRKDLKRGRLEIFLEGSKLKGEFDLVRLKNDQPDSWLLIKKRDAYASQKNVLEQDRSVASGLTLEGIKDQHAAHDPPPKSRGKPLLDLSQINLEGSVQGSMPTEIEPMLATLTEEPFNREGWLFEIKWDGFRAMAEVMNGSVHLYSRNNLGFEEEFGAIVHDLETLRFNAVFDGEIVVVDEQGRSSFQLLQSYRRTGEGILAYYVFDLLYLEGYDLRQLPLKRRKAILQHVLPELPRVKISKHLETQGVQLYHQALEHDVEGIIAKDENSQYRQGVRSKEWLKIKAYQRQETVIGGFTEPRGSRSHLGALLLGVYEGSDLAYVGHTGSGFNQTDLEQVRKRLEPLIRKSSPFKKRPKTNTPPTWVEPELVCEVHFAGWTADGCMRQAIFLGLREDKDPGQVRRELPLPTQKALIRRTVPRRKVPGEMIIVDQHEIFITHPDKLYWPSDGITKRDLIDYLRSMSEVILPYLYDRPESLQRFPNGIEGRHFFQKDMENLPGWIEQASIEPSEEEPGEEAGSVNYLLCQDEAALVYTGNLGAIEINPWNSRLGSLDYPDYLVIDLDPDQSPFEDVIRAAQAVHQVLEEIKVPGFVKTSGLTGLHIFTPLCAKYTYPQTRQFARLITRLVHDALPGITTLARNPKDRKGKVYLDTLQNRRGQTMAAPYCPRPAPGAPVSTPLDWSEVQPGLSPLDFTLKNIQARVEEVGDLWRGVLGPGIDMQRSLEALQTSWPQIREEL